MTVKEIDLSIEQRLALQKHMAERDRARESAYKAAAAADAEFEAFLETTPLKGYGTYRILKRFFILDGGVAYAFERAAQ